MDKQIVTSKRSLTQETEDLLNRQIHMEGASSAYYLAMASWCDKEGYSVSADFLYRHSDEERQHMLKLIRFVNERGGKAVVPAVSMPANEFNTLKNMFTVLLKHEVYVSERINDIVHVSLEEKDYASNNFLQWYVSEQIEEEALARTILDKINLIGDDKGGLYLFDNDIKSLVAQSSTTV